MNPKSFCASILFAALLVTLGNGCAAPPQTQPLFVDPSFEQSPPSGLRLLPVIDGRSDKSTHVNLEDDVRPILSAYIRDRGYKVELVDWPGSTPMPATGDPSAMKQSERIPYLPPGSTPVVVAVLGYASETQVVSSKASIVTISAWAFDPATGKLLWNHTFAGDYTFSGDILTLGLDAAMWNTTRDAIKVSAQGLSLALPIPKGK